MSRIEPQLAAAAESQPGAAWLSPRQTAGAIGALIAVGLLVIVAVSVDLYRRSGIGNLIGNGVLSGTIMSFVNLGAVWVPVGSGRLSSRLMLSLGVFGALMSVITISSFLTLPPMFDRLMAVVMSALLAVVLVAQWMLVQAPLWGLAGVYGLRIARVSGREKTVPEFRAQFGIRQLLIATAVVAVVLGLGRFAVLTVVDSELVRTFGAFRALATVAFLAIWSLFIVLPLFLASLLPRAATLATATALLFAAIATGAEIPLLNKIEFQSEVRTAEIWLLGSMNTAQAAWILAFAGILRLGGYRLTASRAAVAGAGGD